MGGVDRRHRARRRQVLPCLQASARWIVAILLIVLILVVLVMAIAVCLRPQNINLSVLHDHVEAYFILPSSGQILRNATFADLRRHRSSSLDLRFSLSVSNPSGRVSVTVRNITIDITRVVSKFTPYYSYGQQDTFPSEVVSMSRVRLAADPFTLMPESTHTIRKLANVGDAAALDYVADTYRGADSFEVMLRVSLNVYSSPAIVLLKKKGSSSSDRVVTHYCWPVIVGFLDPLPIAADRAQGCTRQDDLPFLPHETLPLPTPPNNTSPSPSPSP